MRLGATMNSSIANSYETKMAVVEAFETLLRQQSFDNISVSQICKEAGIARATFYYHFKDKYDISQWHFGMVAERFLFQTGRTLTWLQANYLNTMELAKHETMYRWCFAMVGYQSLFEHTKRKRIETLRETILDYRHERIDPKLDFQIIALADAEVGGVTHWFVDGMPYDVKTLCLFLDSIVPRRLYNMLNEPVDPSLAPLLSCSKPFNPPSSCETVETSFSCCKPIC